MKCQNCKCEELQDAHETRIDNGKRFNLFECPVCNERYYDPVITIIKPKRK